MLLRKNTDTYVCATAPGYCALAPLTQAARRVAPQLLDVAVLGDTGPWAPQEAPQGLVVDALDQLLRKVI